MNYVVSFTNGAVLGGWKFMPCLIRSPLQPASDSARANIAKTRIGLISIPESIGAQLLRGCNSKWTPPAWTERLR
jgi:hypothetical protein